MRNRKFNVVTMLFVLPLFAIALFYACGNGSVTVVPESGSTISADDQIVITFPNAMDPDSISITGNMAGDSDGGTWSDDKKTLTISAADFWNLSGHRLNINGSKEGGDAIDALELEYTVEFPTFTKFQRADVVIGQADFQGNLCNRGGGRSKKSFCSPYGNVAYGDGKLILGDHDNHRALGFNGIPTSNNASADFVMDQPDFSSNTTGLGRARNGGGFLTSQVYNGKLYTSDPNNGRIKVYNTIPSSSAEPADFVIGQPDFSTNDSNCSKNHLTYFESFLVADDKLIVADSDHNRVLIWNSLPTESGVPPDLVLGQSNFNHCTERDDDQDDMADANPTSRTMDFPVGIWSDGEKLIVSEWDGNRAMIWNQFPTKNFERADVVLGQSDFTSNTSNDDDQDGMDDGQPSSRTFNEATYGIISNGEKLMITDSNNHRILIWNTFPTENFARADVVLGQNSFNRNSSNDDDQNGASDAEPSDRTFSYLTGATIIGNKLIVTDNSNNRYLVFTGN